jgi:uncharacterized protein YndB with AHSA1/START domain
MPTDISPLSVRRSIFVAATPERVWEEFTTLERFRAWFGSRHPLGDGRIGHEVARYEPGPGGYLEWDAGHWDGKPLVFGGKTVTWDPPREATFEIDWDGQGWPAPLLFTFRLTPVADGTAVEIIEHGFERLGPGGPEQQAGAEGGWTTAQLLALRRIVTG